MNEQNPASDLNLGAINDEYDLQIANLKSQLLIAKEERKKTENEFYLIKNRLTKLKNQEITNNLNFQNIKYRFKLILKNRAESNRKINDNFSKFKAKKLKHLSPITNKYFFTNNKNNNMNNNGKNQNKTHSNFYSGLNQKILNENNNYKNYLDKKSDYSLNSIKVGLVTDLSIKKYNITLLLKCQSIISRRYTERFIICSYVYFLIKIIHTFSHFINIFS